MDYLQQIADKLIAAGKSVSCAESCTGGLLAAEFTRLSGSSAWFNMSWVTYSNEAKQRLLGVSPQTLDAYGAVSEQTVHEMAAGARRLADADYALSISGIAGPSGGSAEKPVGTAYFARALRGMPAGDAQYWLCQFDPAGGRSIIRRQATLFALRLLLP